MSFHRQACPPLHCTGVIPRQHGSRYNSLLHRERNSRHLRLRLLTRPRNSDSSRNCTRPRSARLFWIEKIPQRSVVAHELLGIDIDTRPERGDRARHELESTYVLGSYYALADSARIVNDPGDRVQFIRD
eukprot:IDg13668t1